MKNFRTLFVLIVVFLAACGGGSLQNEATLNNYDFKYQPDFSKPYAALENGEVMTLQTRFIWSGESGQEITLSQHALTAFTHRAAENLKNPEGEELWTHGVGAFVGENGLEIELWRRDDPGQNGFEDDGADAVVWSQSYDRCPQMVSGKASEYKECLADKPNNTGFITAAPNFVLRKQVPYFLRVQVKRDMDKRYRVEAELFMNTIMGVELIQSGMVYFDRDRYFPVKGQTLEAVVAKTPGGEGEAIVEYAIFQ